jgi:hypothetical protein
MALMAPTMRAATLSHASLRLPVIIIGPPRDGLKAAPVRAPPMMMLASRWHDP